MRIFAAAQRGQSVVVRRSVAVFALLAGVALGACDSPQSVLEPDPTPQNPTPQDPTPENPGAWDKVLENDTIKGDVVVPAGETWLIGPNVWIEGNLRTDSGTIAMRPGSSLHFIGANPEEYVGGGMGWDPKYARDIGVWVGRAGVLDIRGTPKVGWNRTGSDPSWSPNDELWITPTERGDYAPRRWYPGEPIPQIDPRVPAAEVINVTRDILIEGPAHILITSKKPQRIEYVTLRNMGITNLAHEGPVMGRYALHLHYARDGSRGTMIRGVAAVESGGRVFVPHESHGITMIDNVSVNSLGEAFWWDIGDRTDDLTVDRLAVSGVHAHRSVTGKMSRNAAVTMGGGYNMVMRNSVVSGARGTSGAHGFEWPSGADNYGPSVWEFNEGNVAHNVEGSGVRLWFNKGENHVIENLITYRNGAAGIENGAYRNSHRYINTLSVDDRMVQHSSSNEHAVDGGPSRFEGVEVYAADGAALAFGVLNLPPLQPTEFVDCKLEGSPGSPDVLWNTEKAANPLQIVFRNCGLTPDDFMVTGSFPAAIEGSRIVIENGSDAWEITLDMAARSKVTTRID